MQSVIDFLKGKKTYITATLFGIFNLGVALNWWMPDNQAVLAINTLLGVFGFAFLRAGVTKSGNQSGF